MLNKGDSATVVTDVIDRPALVGETAGELGSSRLSSSTHIPNSCVGSKPVSRKAGKGRRMSESNEIVVGIDVSKERLDVASSIGEPWSASTDEAGLQALVQRLTRLAPSRIVLEATNAPDDVGWKMSAEGMAKAMSSEDFSEGLTAFIEKRAPQWKGR